jgi:hypothetical protein
MRADYLNPWPAPTASLLLALYDNFMPLSSAFPHLSSLQQRLNEMINFHESAVHNKELRHKKINVALVKQQYELRRQISSIGT